MSSETVKVIVRCRPMNTSEKERKCGTCVQVDIAANQIILTGGEGGEAAKVFTYDYVFQQDILQQTVYENSAFPLVESVVEGYNGTIFAYGQTGCGKTHSMLGLPNDEVQKGIIPRSFSHIINIIESTNDKKFLVRCSYIEIYNEEIRDLLGKDVKAKMDLKESPDKGVFVKDLTMVTVKTVAEMEKYMNIGTDNRSVGATKMNSTSSRSHSLFTLYIECSYIPEGQTDEHYTAGKLNLVDLAGSERQSKTEATGDRLKEATKINLSLSALGNVISALVDGKSQHIPYRDSKLTRLLQDSLGGNTKTIMLAAVSPADYNYDETLSTLRYASRAKNIKNQPKVNQDPKDAQLKEYADEIKKLKEMLMQQQGGNITYITNPSGDQQNLNKQISSSNQTGKVQTEKELKQLQEKNEALDAERRKMEEQMKSKDQQFQEELKEKERIRQMLQELEMKMVVGGTADQEKKKKVSQMRSKLKKQMAEHEKMTAEMERKEEDFLFLENKYSSLQEELDATKKIARKLRAKVKQHQGETKDFQRETETEKGDLLDTIRYQERELKIYQTICLMLLTADEIEIIKSQGEWTDDYMTYKLPPFYFKQKKLNFPKLPAIQAQELVNQEKELREVEFQYNSRDNRNNNSNNNQNNYPNKASSNANGNSSKAQQYQNGYQNNEQNYGKPSSNKDTSQQQLANNKYSNNYNSNGNGFKSYGQDDFDNMADAGSIKSITESRRDHYNQSPSYTNKKNSQKSSAPERTRIPNVSLDPLDSRAQNQKLSGLQDTFEASFYSEQRKVPIKNVQLQPISNNTRPPASQSLGELNNRQMHNLTDTLDPLSSKKQNKIKLDKLYVPR